jgi:DNA-binding transcriptional ArsR family regulator
VEVQSSSSSARWELYRTLAEPIRLRLLALVSEEELAIGELAELLGEGQPNVSRHAASLKQAGLIRVKKEGARSLLKLREEVRRDPVVLDALVSGTALCTQDGSLRRIAAILQARDVATREFFAKPRSLASEIEALPPEFGTYLTALSFLLPSRALAVDVGTGDGGLLAALSPAFERVIGLDRAEAQLSLARKRVESLQLSNVELRAADLDDPSLASVEADVAFAVRLLHHAPKPERILKQVASLIRPGGALVLLDYAPHEDERMREQADLWLGFEENDLKELALGAGLLNPRVASVPGPSRGVDAHLPWQVLVAHKRTDSQHSNVNVNANVNR